MTNTPTIAHSNSAQARATRQGAAIALLGAGTASTQTAGSETPFADALNSASEAGSKSQGFFSDTLVATPDKQTNIEKRPRQPIPGAAEQHEEANTDPASETTASPQTNDSGRVPRTGGFKPSTQRTESETPEYQGGNPVSGEQPTVLPNAGPVGEQAPTSPQGNGQPAQNEDAPVTAQTKKTGPTDPLRLIQPQPAPSADSSTPSSSGSTPSTGANGPQSGSASPTNANGSPGSGQTNASPNGQTVQHASPIQSTMSATATNGAFGGYGPQNQSPQAGDGTNSSNGSINPVNGGTKAIGSADPSIAPFRIGGGRPQPPITLKLQATTASANTESISQNEADSIAKIMGRNLNTALNQKTPLVTLWMSPETLGKVKISLTFDQGTISAKFEATSQATKDLLQQNFGALRDALESRGLRADKIEVVNVPDWTLQNNANGGSASPAQGSNGQSPTSGQQPGSGQPGNGQQGSGQPGNGQPSNGQPGSGQPGNGQSGQQNGTPSQGQQEPSTVWTAPNSTGGPQGTTAPLGNGGSVRVESKIDSRLITLNARLELDAVA